MSRIVHRWGLTAPIICPEIVCVLCSKRPMKCPPHPASHSLSVTTTNLLPNQPIMATMEFNWMSLIDVRWLLITVFIVGIDIIVTARPSILLQSFCLHRRRHGDVLIGGTAEPIYVPSTWTSKESRHSMRTTPLDFGTIFWRSDSLLSMA